MKQLFKFLLFAAIVGGVIYAIKNVLAPPNNEFASADKGSGVLPTASASSLDDKPLGGKISDDLLKILVCPEDKGPLELVDNGKYLLNPRNGYRYPIRDGIPVMLIEEGKKNSDSSFAASNGTDAAKETAS